MNQASERQRDPSDGSTDFSRQNRHRTTPGMIEPVAGQLGVQWLARGTEAALSVHVSRGGDPYYCVQSQRLLGGAPKQRFPVTEVGWRDAWRVLVETDPAAADTVIERTERMAAKERDRDADVQIDLSLVTTLASLPGLRIVRALGLVSQVSATSGFTATTKGQGALSEATEGFMSAAAKMGENAIVGVSAHPFGAAGGITSAFGGDAVGVLLLGTAVVVEPESEKASADPVTQPEV